MSPRSPAPDSRGRLSLSGLQSSQRRRDSSLFGLAPCGVCPARGIAVAAVRSYRTFSPLPWRCHQGGMFSVALSVESPTLSQKPRKDGPPSRTLSGTLLCGVRTFLSPRPKTREAAVRSGCLRNHYIGRTFSHFVADPESLQASSA